MAEKKYTDEQIDAYLDQLDIQLWPCQREMFKRLVNSEDRVYVSMAHRHGSKIMWKMLEQFNEMMKGGPNL